MNVLVYDGPGVTSLQRVLLKTLTSILRGYYDVLPVNPLRLQKDPWENSTSLLVMPGGRDLEFLSSLEPAGIQKIRNYVLNGGKYFGICGGAYLACQTVEFEIGRPHYEVIGLRPLRFCNAIAIGSISDGFEYNTELGTRAMEIKSLQDQLHVYVNGGPYFKLSPEASKCKVLYRYAENGEPCILDCEVGDGRAILSGCHLEVSSEYIKSSIHEMEGQEKYRDELENLKNVFPRLDESDIKRQKLLGQFLQLLGLKTTGNIVSDDILHTSPAMWVVSEKKSVLDSFYLELTASCSKDSNSDHIQIDDSINTWLIPKNYKSMENIAYEEPKITLQPYGGQEFELFDIHKYQIYRKKCPNPLGSLLFYAPNISSSQSTMDKYLLLIRNDIFSAALPHGSVFLASRQYSGRGRGSNSWISQDGCLMFSLRLKHQQVSSIVFIQYLMGLAVVQSVKKSFPEIPIHLKWPNDIFVKTINGLQKLGGILVNSEYQYETATFLVTVGCGVNVLNSAPSVCMQDLTCEKVEIESVLAGILWEFNCLYQEMIDESSSLDCFSIFRQRYYDTWLHSKQSVKIRDSRGEETDAEVVGLDRSGFLTAQLIDGTVITLQPDGNSFDMMKNLIKVKE